MSSHHDEKDRPEPVFLMRMRGFEPPRPEGHLVLSQARLPFRHIRERTGILPPVVERVKTRGRRAPTERV